MRGWRCGIPPAASPRRRSPPGVARAPPPAGRPRSRRAVAPARRAAAGSAAPPRRGGRERKMGGRRETRLDILDKVYFAPGKAAIQSRSTRLLNQIARVLKSHPEVVRVEVQGHTDSNGGTAMNMTLSQARAEAVVGALIRRGVSADRMVARGFGPTQPIATNATRQGREKNRRVEFRVAQRRTAGEVIDIAP